MSNGSDSPAGSEMSAAIRQFSQVNGEYYDQQFSRILSTSHRVWSFNWAAALLGPLWASARGVWGFFWWFVLLELVALVHFGRGLWGDLGASKLAEADRLQRRASELAAQAEENQLGADASTDQMRSIAENLSRAAQESLLEAEQAVAGGTTLLIVGVAMFLAVRIAVGILANGTYEKQFSRWHLNRAVPCGINRGNALLGALLVLIMYPLTLYRFTASRPDARITDFPVGTEYYTKTATVLEAWIDRLAGAGQGIFNGITAAVQGFLDLLELILVGTPWPVVVVFTFVVAWRLAGMRVAIFTLAALAYLGFLELWETSMITFALVGTAAAFCVILGIPLGIWCAKSSRVYAMARPVLDLMQTLPPFVYLIPTIAFFGTGKVPGILATIIVAIPPIIRLTALGIMQVDRHVKEAARAFGASARQVLTGVELPLATPSIMTGVNQVILHCLGMVVIAALIGAKGLGQNVVDALLSVRKGEGIIAGLAIMLCAMLLDRIVQGRFQRQDDG